MARSRNSRRVLVAAGLAASLGAQACNDSEDAALGKSAVLHPTSAPVVKPDGPKLGAVANVTGVHRSPAPNADRLGFLSAGALVPRAEQPQGTAGCEAGWYPIHPRGFVCSVSATTDLEHPTLMAMAMRPNLADPVPYTYARVTRTTSLFERAPDAEKSVRPLGKLSRRSLLAIVGSWTATDPEGAEHRLGLTTQGQFVKATDLEAAEAPDFAGVELDADHKLPIGFVVKRGVSTWKVEDQKAEKADELGYHHILHLTGRYRELGDVRYWDAGDDRYVRHRDVTVVRRRHIYPDFATPKQKWIDVSIVTGTLVAYEGQRAVFVTLVSVGRDRLGDPETTASTAQGTFEIVGKQITGSELDPRGHSPYYSVYDAPWVLELSSGQSLHAALWHDRFGIEHSDGSVHLSAADARRLWTWVTPELPEGWHGVRTERDAARSIVHVRK